MSDEILFEMQRSLGRIEQKIDSAAAALADHAADDKTVQKALFERIEGLQMSHARQKGFITALTSLGSVIGAVGGYVAERVLGHH